MANPWFYSEGNGQRFGDTRLRIWTKILGSLQNSTGALSANNPQPGDTIRRIKQKINKSRAGVT